MLLNLAKRKRARSRMIDYQIRSRIFNERLITRLNLALQEILLIKVSIDITVQKGVGTR